MELSVENKKIDPIENSKRDDALMEQLFKVVPEVREFLLPESELLSYLDGHIKNYYHARRDQKSVDLGPIKDVVWPYISLGNITSFDLFSLAKFMHFIYLRKNLDTYKTVFDVGGNVGLDSIVFEKAGHKVYSFEPDPMMVDIMNKNIELNGCKNITVVDKALSPNNDEHDFVRVKGNLTANHIDGARAFHGDIERLKVQSITFDEVGVIPDFMKINIEGFEAQLVPAIPAEYLDKCDFLISIHDEKGRDIIYDFLKKNNMNIFTQRTGWNQVSSIDDLPGKNKEGYIFASRREAMLW